MEQDCGSWCPPQRLNPPSLKLNSLFAPTHSKHQDTISVSKTSDINLISASGLSVYAQPPYPNVVCENEPHCCFSGFPRFQQQSMPIHGYGMKELDPTSSALNHVESFLPKTGSEFSQKRLLVFDQSGDQTTLIFCSGIGKPFPHPTSWNPKPPATDDSIIRNKVDLNIYQEIIPREDFDERYQPDVQSEMHEDTEELNALLYSDDESDFSKGEEVTSSGHLPSTVSAHDNPEASVGSTEGVVTFTGHSRKRKMDGGSNKEALSLLNASNSMKRSKLCYEGENDAESCCASGGLGSLEFVSGDKRVKKEKISETVSLLRGIVPSGERDDPIVVLDKAINYLKSLKLKAKSLGLDTL